jgi:hypothetical protein
VNAISPEPKKTNEATKKYLLWPGVHAGDYRAIFRRLRVTAVITASKPDTAGSGTFVAPEISAEVTATELSASPSI